MTLKSEVYLCLQYGTNAVLLCKDMPKIYNMLKYSSRAWIHLTVITVSFGFCIKHNVCIRYQYSKIVGRVKTLTFHFLLPMSGSEQQLIQCFCRYLSHYCYCMLQVAMDDAQISDISLRVLSLLVQLFGGENKHSLDPENLVMYLVSYCWQLNKDCRSINSPFWKY